MRLPIQIEVIVFRQKNNSIEYLLLKRTKENGGFWQPISGGLRDTESVEECLKRESREEIGTDNFIRIIPDVDFFQFDEFNTYRKEEKVCISEFVFGAELSEIIKIDIFKNDCKEHEEFKWCNYETALKKLKWDSNKKALKKLNKLLN